MEPDDNDELHLTNLFKYFNKASEVRDLAREVVTCTDESERDKLTLSYKIAAREGSKFKEIILELGTPSSEILFTKRLVEDGLPFRRMQSAKELDELMAIARYRRARK